MGMFCYQCEQTAQGKGCTVQGVCGKTPEVAEVQDLIVYVLKGISLYAYPAFKMGKVDNDLNRFVAKAMFSTLTNTNFDKESLKMILFKAVDFRTRVRQAYEDACIELGKVPESFDGYADFVPSSDEAEMLKQAEAIAIPTRKESLGEDITGLQELVTYGLKGAAAYADHAAILGKEDNNVYEFFYEALSYLTKPNPTVDELFDLSMRCGEMNLHVMELLDEANTGSYGSPEPTQVRITPVKGKCILVSGHDLQDLDKLLQQTEGKDINVYTHGEMLPCNAYPELKKYKHLVGNYGGAWQLQNTEFPAFPGPVLMTTNCLQNPKGYEDKMFTCGLVQWEGVKHISDQNFKPVIDKALEMEGFTEDEEEKTITTGFAHDTILTNADKLIPALKNGDIRHIFFIGGCDGAKPGRNYFTEFADNVPKDCIILTAGCGKYRFNKHEFGDINGIPRLLDMGQCNDSYSAIKVAVVLAEVFETEINKLPLSLIVSWYEQKAVAILLSLLHLGIKNIRLGPTLPAFISQNVLNVLVDKFNIMPTVNAQEDLKAILG